MLTDTQIERIHRYVNEKCFDVDKLIQYLNRHDIVGLEIFELVAKRDVNVNIVTGERENVLTPRMLEGESKVFDCLPVDVFVKRVPFYFAVKECSQYNRKEEVVGKVWIMWLECVLECIGDKPGSSFFQPVGEPLTVDTVNEVLEYAVTECNFDIEKIDDYLEPYYSSMDGISYVEWLQYVQYCRTLDWNDLMPSNLFYSFNCARVELGMEPIVFLAEEYPHDLFDMDEVTYNTSPYMYYKRTGREIEICGCFPVNPEGEPILEWIGINVNDPEEIEYCNDEMIGRLLVITIKPTTTIRLLVPAKHSKSGYALKDGGTRWVTIYSGAQTMKLNPEAIKRRRKELGYTQREVADAVQANLRTYQKWESGETVPDGFFLLRILNWLDIPNVNDVITYIESREGVGK